MMKIHGDFRYHGVGQGLFCSGRIQNFNFIFDCGSQNFNILECAILHYRNYLLNSRMIDLLVISHFDQDHVNGLHRLLNDVDLNTVIIPYVSPIERLMLALRNTKAEEWYYELLSNPIEYFLKKKKARRIVLIVSEPHGQNEPRSSNRNNYENNIGQIDIQAPTLFFEDEMDNEVLIKHILEQEPELKDVLSDNKVSVFAHNVRSTLDNCWLFQFFNSMCRLDPNKMEEFQKCLSAQNIKGNEQIKRIIRSNDLSSLKDCYKLIKRELNPTSLILLHGPTGHYRRTVFCQRIVEPSVHLDVCQKWCCCSNFTDEREGVFDQILMGDAHIKNEMKNIKNRYGSSLSNVFIGQLPHHGSKSNWGSNLNLLNEFINCELWIASAGFSNKYSHPSLEIVQKISGEGKRVFLCNEFCSCYNRVTVEWA